MSLRINHNTSAVNAHRNLQNADIEIGKSLEKLSSGLSINRAADGPASLAISEQMRAQLAGINQAISNSETSISMVQTAEAALNEMNSIMVSMRQLAIHASNEGANDDVMLQADQQEIINSIEALDRIAKSTQFGTKKLLDGSTGANGTATGDGLQFVRAGYKTKASQGAGYEVVITENARKSSIVGESELTDEIVQQGEVLTILEGGKSASYKTTDLDTVETAIQNLQTTVIREGLDVDVSLTEDGNVQVTHNKYGSDSSFQVVSTTSGVLSEGGGIIDTVKNGVDIAGTINSEVAVGKGQTLTGINGTPNIDGLQVRYMGDAGRAGGQEIDDEDGLLIGYVQVSQNSLTFQVGGNRDQTASISLLNTSPNRMGIGIENNSGFQNLSEIDVTSTQGAQDALNLIDQSIDEVSSSRAELGAFQKNTLERNLSNLRIASENLAAAESNIRDTDIAGELAKHTRNKIMLESASAMLAQATQVPSMVLELL